MRPALVRTPTAVVRARSATVLAAALVVAASASCSSSGKPITGPPAGAASSETSSSGAPSRPASAPTTRASRSTAAAAGAGRVDVCSLLSARQASRLNHVTYGATTPASPAAGFDTCRYKNAGHADPVDIQDLQVTVMSIPGCWPGVKSADGPGTPIAGVGDAAFGAQIGIYVEAGSRCVTILGLTHAELMGDYTADAQMAKIILSRLS